LLAACFALCLLALAGLPPMPGFIGKLTMIQGVFDTADTSPWLGWAFVALLLVSGFATLIGLARIGIQTFWANDDRDSPVMAIEIAPIMALIAVLAVISIESEAVLRYTDRTAQALHQTSRYAQGVLTAPRADDAQPPTPEDVP
ncbi:proton-conducting transporter transmembrane domain-containing protein, partial [Paracoccus sp. (in: a-proteobacteria)]